jgi:hypothetical protein
MTLIASIRCKEGIVLCADAQETVGSYRVAVQKIIPFSVAGCQLIIAGSGHADLIDSFVMAAHDAIAARGTAGCDIKGLRSLLHDTLVDFYAKDVRLCPDPKRTKRMRLFIAAHIAHTKQYEVWLTKNTRLQPIGKHELIGWDEPLYKVSMKRFYHDNIPLTQAALAATYVLTIAKETSLYVGGELSLAIVKDSGIWMEEQQYIKTLEERLKTYENYTTQLLLGCADTSVYSTTLAAWMDQLGKLVRSLHEQQINAVLEDAWKRGDEHCTGYAIERVPPGIMVEKRSDGSRVIRHDVNGIEEMIRMINEANKASDSQDTELKPADGDESKDKQ